MPHINAFRPVVYEKIFEDLSKCSLFLPTLVETGLVILEKNFFKYFPIYYYIKI